MLCLIKYLLWFSLYISYYLAFFHAPLITLWSLAPFVLFCSLPCCPFHNIVSHMFLSFPPHFPSFSLCTYWLVSFSLPHWSKWGFGLFFSNKDINTGKVLWHFQSIHFSFSVCQPFNSWIWLTWSAWEFINIFPLVI